MTDTAGTSARTGLGELLLAVDHVGIAVPDLQAAIDFHTEVLGLRLEHREENPEQGVVEAMLVAPDSGARVQLLAPLTSDSAIATFLDRSGPGLQQLAYRVSDVTEAASRLTAAGLRVLYPEPRVGTAGSRINFVHPRDTGGVLIELVETGPDQELLGTPR